MIKLDKINAMYKSGWCSLEILNEISKGDQSGLRPCLFDWSRQNADCRLVKYGVTLTIIREL